MGLTMRVARAVLTVFAMSCACVAQAADDAPQLMLDTGGHMAIIKGLAFTADGNQLVSAGDDKVVRVWDWRSGTTVRTIRGQVGPGHEGKIFGMALSPDGRWMAVGGWLGPFSGQKPREDEEAHAIRLYDFASGRLVALLRGHTNVVNALTFSPDSRRLVSGQNADLSAIVWDVASRKPIHRLMGHTAPVYGVAFSTDGQRVITASEDRTLRLWRAGDGSLIAEMKGHGARILGSLAVSRDGTIASGDRDGEVRLWDGTTGQFLRSFVRKDGAVGRLVFSPDGRWLLASAGEAGTYNCQVWDVRTGQLATSYRKHDNTSVAVAISPDNRFAATGGGNNNEIHIWDLATGETQRILAGTGKGKWAAGFASDPPRISWGSTARYTKQTDRGPIEWQLTLPSGTRVLGQPRRIAAGEMKDFARAVGSYGTYSLDHREGGTPSLSDGILELKRGGRTLFSIARDSTTGFAHRTYTFTPDGKSVISSSDVGEIASYDLAGKVVGKFIGHESVVWGLAPSRDGRLLVSVGNDQTTRLWNARSHELIVTLFHGNDGEWVMWTPQGYYTASPDGEKIVGWQINRGLQEAADYVNANQLRSHFYRPDIVDQAIILASADAAMKQARNTSFSLAALLSRRPPGFAIMSPQDRSRAVATPAQVRLKLEPNTDPVDGIDVLVNGRQTTTPTLRNATARAVATGLDEHFIDVPLEQGENKIRIVARNKVGQTVKEFILFHDRRGQLDARGTLYVLAIGVDKYARLPSLCGPDKKQSCNLRFAGKDARAFRDVLVKRTAPLYKEVKTLLLSSDGDKPPTKANIEDALGEMLGRAGPEDTTVLFIAGHGVNDGRSAEYLFLPAEAESSADGWRRSTVVPWTQLQSALHNTQGRRLMFADTCHSGGAYNARLVNDAHNANIIIFAATDTQTLAWELAHLSHGAFTYALIQGLEGKARRSDGSVTVLGLGAFISDEVASLTEDKQKPTFHISGATNFMLARP